jgi:orotidine-5'-phosphate decarboxylase
VNNSRGLVFAYQRPEYRDRFGGDWQRAIEAALDEMIDDLASNTAAGRLRA